MITKATMQRINEVNDLLITAKNRLIDAVNQAETMEEKIDIAKAQACVQAGIKVILKTFYPIEEFDEAKWLARRTVKDAEHDARVQKILDDSAQRQEQEEIFEKSKEGFDNFQKEAKADLEKEMRKIRFGNSTPKEEIKDCDCSHDCKDCDSREVAGDEEYCLQGEEMK